MEALLVELDEEGALVEEAATCLSGWARFCTKCMGYGHYANQNMCYERRQQPKQQAMMANENAARETKNDDDDYYDTALMTVIGRGRALFSGERRGNMWYVRTRVCVLVTQVFEGAILQTLKPCLCALTHSLTHSLTHALTHSLTHALTHPYYLFTI